MSNRRGVGKQHQKDLRKFTRQDVGLGDFDNQGDDQIDWGLYPGNVWQPPDVTARLNSAKAEMILTENYLNKRFKQRKLEDVKAEENDELYMPAEIVRAVRGLPLKSKRRRKGDGQGGGNQMGLGALEKLEQNGGAAGEQGNEDREDGDEDDREDLEVEGEEEYGDDYGVDHYASDGEYGGDDDGGNDAYF